MENLIAALAVDGKYLMANTIKNLMERDKTLQNAPKDNQKAIVQDMTARCLVVAQALCCTLEEAYKEINKVDWKYNFNGENKTMTKKQFDKINNDVNKLLNGKKIKGIDLSVYDIRELVNVLENLKKKPEFINGNVKKFCDKYGIKVCEYGVGWKVL